MSWFSEHSAALQGIGGLAAIAAAVVAVFTLLRAGLDSASRTRPYVVVELDLPEYRYKRLDLVVRNAGPTAARDVSITFDPPFETSKRQSRLAPYVAERYAEPLPVLGPGQELRSILAVDPTDDAKSDLPARLTARVAYRSPWWRRRYSDTFELRRVIYEQQVFSEPSDSERNSLKKIRESLEAISQNERKLLRQVRDMQESIVAALGSIGPAQPAVAWRVRERDDEIVLVENVGGTTAYAVQVTGSESVRYLDVIGGQGQTVRPGEHLKVVVMGHGDDAELTATWVADPQQHQEVSTWCGRIPW